MQPAISLETQIRSLLTHFPGVVGLVVADLSGGDELRINENERFLAASLIKLPILWEFFRQVGAGLATTAERLTLSDADKVGGAGILQDLDAGLSPTLKDVATLMITLSDNTATNLLIERLGLAAINQTIEALGLKHTELQRKLMDYERARQGFENFTSPADIAELLHLMHDPNRLPDHLSADSRRAMIAILKRQQRRNKLPTYLPPEAVLAHKTGEIPGCEHDAGILYREDGAVLVAVLTKQLDNNRDGIRLCAEIGKLVYDNAGKMRSHES